MEDVARLRLSIWRRRRPMNDTRGMRTTLAWLMGGALTLLGCGGNGSEPQGPAVSAQGGAATGGAAAFSLGVPSDLILGSLSDAQNQQLCLDTKNFYSALGATLKEGTCNRVGINAALGAMTASDATARSTCQSAHDACVTQPGGMSNVTCDDKPDASCLATVAEYTACVADASELLATQFNSLPACQSLTTDLLPSLGAGGAGPSPASCMAVVQKCPQAAIP